MLIRYICRCGQLVNQNLWKFLRLINQQMWSQQWSNIRNPHKDASETKTLSKWPKHVWFGLDVFVQAKSRNTDCKRSYFCLPLKYIALFSYNHMLCSLLYCRCVFVILNMKWEGAAKTLNTWPPLPLSYNCFIILWRQTDWTSTERRLLWTQMSAAYSVRDDVTQ